MPDLHSLEDAATLYVVGQLTEAEQAEFAARLAESAELRALVRKLEEGVVATAMASPQQRAPKGVWERIERTVTEESKPRLDFSFWFGWLRNGWAVAAACLFGWLLYALWVNRPGVSVTSVALRTPVASVTNSHPEATAATSEHRETTAAGHSRIEAGALVRLVQSKTQEIGALRSQIVQLTNRVAQMSNDVALQQALLSEPDRLKFFQLGPGVEGARGSNAPISGELQRALLLAVARELGWLGAPENVQSGSTRTNIGGVDFVDLQPGGDATTQTNPPLGAGTPSDTSATPTEIAASDTVIPGFVSGTNVVMVFGSSYNNCSGQCVLSLSSGSSPGLLCPVFNPLALGTNPTVVSMPTIPGCASFDVYIGSSFIGQFPPPGLAPIPPP